mgnify:CR=1 FL=1
MNNITAAIGTIQVDRLDGFIKMRKEIYDSYNNAFYTQVGIKTPPELIKDCTNSYYFYWIQVDNRDELAAFLKENGVYTTFRYWPLNKVKYFNIDNSLSFPNAEFASSRTLNLPIHQSLSEDDVNKIISLVLEFTN